MSHCRDLFGFSFYLGHLGILFRGLIQRQIYVFAIILRSKNENAHAPIPRCWNWGIWRILYIPDSDQVVDPRWVSCSVSLHAPAPVVTLPSHPFTFPWRPTSLPPTDRVLCLPMIHAALAFHTVFNLQENVCNEMLALFSSILLSRQLLRYL